jgi:hypothetical protein
MTQVTETKRPKLHLPFALMGTTPVPALAANRRDTAPGHGPDALRRLVAAMID